MLIKNVFLRSHFRDGSLFMMKILGKIPGAIFILLLVVSCSIGKQRPLLTKLEGIGHIHLTSSAEIAMFLTELSRRNTTAEKVTVASSALGSPIDALLVSSEMNRFKKGYPSNDRISFMLIGSQHGTEPSGAEALLLLSREIVEGGLKSYLEGMNFIIIPNSNPDGSNLNRRVNGNRVNLSTNYTILSEPESRGIIDVLHRWKPEVVLDVHESAVLKKKSLGRQGYLTDFEAQFEAANNPNVDRQIRTFSYNTLLPEVISLVNAQGLPAQRYIGEITDIHQPITHGGLSLRNLRNMAGMMGSLSFLLENRLDPSTGSYQTPRNIRARVTKQYLCISSFLSCCCIHRSEIIELSRNARMRWRTHQAEDPLYLFFAYVADQNRPQITLPLRKLETGESVKDTFKYYGNVEYHSPFTLPAAYIVTVHKNLIKEFLDRHHIAYETAKQPVEVPVEIQYIVCRQGAMTETGQACADYSVRERVEKYTLHQSDLIIRLDQPARRLIPLFLEPQSLGSIFNSHEYRHFLKKQGDFFIYRIRET